MRRGLFIAGLVVLVLGVLLLAGGYYLVTAPTSVSITPCNGSGSCSEGTLTTTGVGTASFSVSWSGASASTVVYLTTTPIASSSCGSPAGVVAHGSGASGSFSASMSSGTSYYLFVCSPSSLVTLTYSVVGISYLMIIGIVLAVVGALLAVLGYRAKARVPSAAPEEEAPMEEAPPYVVPEPITATSAPEPTREPIGVRATPPEPARYMPASAPEPGRASDAPASDTQGRPMKVCAKCGTVNEPWITNCRKCKRPLGSTGTS